VLVAALALAAWPLAAWCAALGLITGAPTERAGALVVLSGSANYVERVNLAAELFREGRAPKIVLTNDYQQSGWLSAEQRNPFFVERAQMELARAGVPAERVETLPRAVTSTYEEALLLREYAAEHDLHSILIVTSAYHSRRVLWTFRCVFNGSGVEIGLRAVAPGEQTPRPAAWWFYALGWRMVAGEYVKLIYYRAQYS
jgi:uncharacterized SAM-binding protein YcdF (DUF218 family)